MARMLKRRKFSRRSKPYSKRRLYKKSKRLTTRVKRVERIAKKLYKATEVKCITGYKPDVCEQVLASTSSTSEFWVGKCLNAVPIGTSGGQRIGSEWVEKSILLTMNVYTTAANPSTPTASDHMNSNVRIMLLRFPQLPTSGVPSAPTPASFMQMISGVSDSLTNGLGPYKLEERKNFTVLYDKIVTLSKWNKPTQFLRTKIRLGNFKPRCTAASPVGYASFDHGPLMFYAISDGQFSSSLQLAYKYNFTDQ